MATRAARRTDKPGILVIWGDDIGITNLSCYSDGVMGYRTPSIDNWKVVFMEQRAAGTLRLWAEPFVPLRVPKLYNQKAASFTIDQALERMSEAYVKAA
jgi:hypothetical protein